MTRLEITEEDRINIAKWMTATNMMIQAKLRTPLSDSERQTFDKIWYSKKDD